MGMNERFNFTKPLLIGNVRLELPLALAPMAGVCDLAFRETCEKFGASYTCTEMVSAKALVHHDKKTETLLMSGRCEKPFAAQIFGSEPCVMAYAAQIAADISSAKVIDINMGCPMPKIVSNGDGCALMLSPVRASEIISAVSRAVNIPVTVKHRAGWDDNSINAVEFAKMCEASGAAAICVHGRTARQLYTGLANRKIIAEVKNSVKIPVFANGDIFTLDDAIDMLCKTNADGISIARGALGNPWLFAQIRAFMKNEKIPDIPPVDIRLRTLYEQTLRAAELKGERTAMLQARQHIGKYLKNIRGAKALREQAVALSSIAQLSDFISLAVSALCSDSSDTPID